MAVLLIPVWAYVSLYFYPDYYFRAVQEDEFLEWLTFWSFLVSGGLFAICAMRGAFSFRNDWFLAGLVLFCLFVAFEEISWGQRIFGLSPPEYFLAENYQQEINLHNLISEVPSELLMYLVVFVYGVVLPLLTSQPALGGLANRLGVVTAPLGLVPAFLLTTVVYATEHLPNYTEWAEAMTGLCFLSIGLVVNADRLGAGLSLKRVVLVATGVALAGSISIPLSRVLADDDANNILRAQDELGALRNDILSGRALLKCGTHVRLYALANRYGQSGLFDGEFTGLVQRGLAEERAAYFLDPWNHAYWIMVGCPEPGKRVSFVYSFGPNMKRDAMSDTDLGDDVLVYIEE